MVREIGRFHPTAIHVHYDDEEDHQHVEDCTSFRAALELADELKQDDTSFYMDIEARDSNSGAWVRLYLAEGDADGWYFQVQINEETFREHAEKALSTERDAAVARLSALQRLLSVSTDELMEIAAIHEERTEERRKAYA